MLIWKKKKSNKTSNQPLDLNKTTEKGRNARASSTMLSHLLFFHLCGLLIINVAITVSTTLLHPSLRSSGKRKVNAVLWRSPLNSKAWTENEHWGSSELLLHLLEPVMSRVISTLLFYKSRGPISPPPTLWINENQAHNHTFNFITLPLCEQEGFRD